MSIRSAIEDLYDLFQYDALPVVPTRWQGVDVSKQPAAEMREMLHVNLEADLRGIEDLQYYQNTIQPNLPWADKHFEERVCGLPINPGIEWANWPWGVNAEKSLDGPVGPLMAPQDWAYLAGLIDGEATVQMHSTKSRPEKLSPRIIIAQVDKPYLTSVYETFNVGTLVDKKPRETNLGHQEITRWSITAREEVEWVLRGVLPYLGLKKERAIEALEYIRENPPKETKHTRKKLWGKVWPKTFNHNYMQRYWPRTAENGTVFRGHRHEYGDLGGLVRDLAAEPDTRQAYLPVWFPEDTGDAHKGRKPCTLGYHFIMRRNKLDVVYYLRSCDFAHHFRDDVYLTIRLLHWVLTECRRINPEVWKNVQMGKFVMQITSLHMFINDFRKEYPE